MQSDSDPHSERIVRRYLRGTKFPSRKRIEAPLIQQLKNRLSKTDKSCPYFRKKECMFEYFRPEKLYFQNNHKTAIDVAQARGVTLLAATNAGIPIYEYTPLQVKQSVVGYGRAEKPQVMEMTRKILGLATVPKPDDTADALAIAICHGHSSGTLKLKQGI